MKDVADLAQVSTTTVSHVINNTRYVSNELRQRVFVAMRDLGYHPNSLARSLRRGETKTIALITPDASNPFFAEIARLIEDFGYNNDYSVIFCNSDNNIDKQLSYVETMISKQVDGIVFISAGDSEVHLQLLSNFGIPVIVVDRNVPADMADVVMIDNDYGGYEATKYLISLGHRRIACITGPSDITPSAARVHGYRRALKEANIPEVPGYVVSGDFQLSGGITATRRILKITPLPTALFVCNDIMALGAISAARSENRRIPQDLSVVGFDDISLAAATHPPLTTMAQPIHEIARIASQTLIDRLQSKAQITTNQTIILKPKLVIRDSCQVVFCNGNNGPRPA